MTYLTIKYIKGNPYLYEVRSEREGDRVRQVFVRYLGRADRADNIARQAGREIPVSVEPERGALPVGVEPKAVAPVTPEVAPEPTAPIAPEPVVAPEVTPQQKEPWEMTRREFKISDYTPKVDAIQQAIRDGKPIILTTHQRATQLTKPEHIRLSGSTIQIPQGSKWVALTDDQVQTLGGQAGVKPVPFEERIYHHAEVEKALSEGKEVSPEVLKDYPELVPPATTPEKSKKVLPVAVIEESVELPLVGESVSGLTVRHDIPNQASIESSLEDYEILKGIREIPTSETGEITQPKFYSVEQEEVTRKLAEEIKASGEINPLILVITDTGDYILEGSHRLDALRLLGIKSFPAQVVIDRELVPEGIPTIKGITQPPVTPEVTEPKPPAVKGVTPEVTPTPEEPKKPEEVKKPSDMTKADIMAAYYRKHGIKVNDDNTVTLYHSSPKLENIKNTGIIKAGASAFAEGESSAWFAPSREAVEKWTSGGSSPIIEVRVPVEAIKHPPKDFEQLFVVGGVKRVEGDLWIPIKEVPDTWHNRIAERELGIEPIVTPEVTPPQIVEPEAVAPPAREINVGQLAKQYGLDIEMTEGAEGGEYTGGTVFVGTDTTPIQAFAANWVDENAPDFRTSKSYPNNVTSEAHEVAHGLFSKNPEAGQQALADLKALGVPNEVAFESLVDTGGLYLLEPNAITNPKIKGIISNWLSEAQEPIAPTPIPEAVAPPVEPKEVIPPVTPEVAPPTKPERVMPEIEPEAVGEKRIFASVTKSTDPTQIRAPWRVAYTYKGEEHAGHFSSKIKALEYAKEKLGVDLDPKTLQPLLDTETSNYVISHKTIPYKKYYGLSSVPTTWQTHKVTLREFPDEDIAVYQTKSGWLVSRVSENERLSDPAYKSMAGAGGYGYGTEDEAIQAFIDQKLSKGLPKVAPEKETEPSIKEIPYSRDLDIRNVEALPKGTGAKYLVTLKGQGDELIAKQWAKVKPSSLKPDEILVDMTPH